jgi:AraC-like DNA-binding protein
MSAGSLFVIHPDDKTTFDIKSESIDIYNILFMPELINEGVKELKSDFDFFAIFGCDFQEASHEYREMLYVLDSGKETERLIKKIDKEYSHEEANYRNMIKLYLQELLINISRLAAGKLRKGKGKNIIQYIDHIIETHFHEDFDFDFLAAQVGLNKTYMSRLYSKTTGKTITQALLKHRLDCAIKLLHYSSKNISEICYECGFNDLSYFYRTFKRTTGSNPGQYRKKLGL